MKEIFYLFNGMLLGLEDYVIAGGELLKILPEIFFISFSVKIVLCFLYFKLDDIL